MLTRRPTTDEPEAGSVAVAMLIMMIVSLLAATALTTSHRSLASSRQRASAAGALMGAELGLVEAQALLQAGESPPFDGGGELSQGSYRYYVIAGAEGEALLAGEGTVNGVSRLVEERTLLPDPNVEPFALFVATELVVETDTALISGRVGTNGLASFLGVGLPGSNPNVPVELNGVKATCPLCRYIWIVDEPNELTEPAFPEAPTPEKAPSEKTEVEPDVPQECNDDQVFEGVLDGRSGLPYLCESILDGGRVTFKEVTGIENPPFTLYVGSSRELSFVQVETNLDAPADDFVVFVRTQPAGPQDIKLSSAHVSIRLYAPGRTAEPSEFTLHGSLTLDTLHVDATSGAFTITPDAESSTKLVAD